MVFISNGKTFVYQIKYIHAGTKQPSPVNYPGSGVPKKVVHDTSVTKEGNRVIVTSRRVTETDNESRISEEITEYEEERNTIFLSKRLLYNI